MTINKKMELDVVVFFMLYIILIVMVILEHNILDVSYLVLLTFYLLKSLIVKKMSLRKR